MVSVKELRSVELSSYTIISTAIAVLFSAIFAIVLIIGIGIISPAAVGGTIYLIPTIIVGTLMYTTYSAFCQGYLYNLLAKRMNTIQIAFKDGKEIVKLSTTSTAIVLAIIATIQVILIYLVSVFLLPLMISALIQTFMFSGNSQLAYGLYEILMLMSQPAVIAMVIFGTFIITFVFVLLGCYIYNILANSGRGAIVNLSNEDNMTVIESVDVLKFAIVFGVVGGILNFILALISLVSGGDITTILINIVSGFVGAFVDGALLAIFYNFLAPRLGKLKLELIDQ